MKRDWAKIKGVLKQVEAQETLDRVKDHFSEDERYSDHVVLLAREGYLVTVESSDREIVVDALTMKGHDLLEQLREKCRAE